MSAFHGGIVGVVHLRAMPGDPRHDGGGFASVWDGALADAEALARGGVSGIIVENFGSVPFAKGTADDPVPPHQVATIAGVAAAIAHAHGLPTGVNCLRNDAMAAMGIACARELAFIRVNVHTGAYLTDQGIIEGRAHDTLRYRQQLGGDAVAIWADVLVKHAAPLAATTPEQATADCVHRGLADAIIVTGDATGAPVSEPVLQRVRGASAGRPVIVGSGLDLENGRALAPLCHAAIVGTHLKHDGRIGASVDAQRVERLVDAVGSLFAPWPGASASVD